MAFVFKLLQIFKEPSRSELYLIGELSSAGTSCSSDFHMKSSVSFTFSVNWLARTLARSRHSAAFSGLRRSILIKSTATHFGWLKQCNPLHESHRCVIVLSGLTHRKNQRDCSSVDMDVQVTWSTAPYLWPARSTLLIQRRAARPDQRAERCQNVAGGLTAGPDDYLEPDGTVWWPGCER